MSIILEVLGAIGVFSAVTIFAGLVRKAGLRHRKYTLKEK